MTWSAADRLGLAAAPTFALVALLNAVGGDPAQTLCSAASRWPLGDMVSMYLLMSLFHLTPWLKLISRREERR